MRKAMWKLKTSITDVSEERLSQDGYYLRRKRVELSSEEIGWNHTFLFRLNGI
tara:strand:- start:313 stop:471 length:159 start_codon:yes stop_codon:yes gene_type:complete